MPSEPLPPEPSSPGQTLSGIIERIRANREQHQRRMAEDPSYRAEVEKREAEALAQETRWKLEAEERGRRHRRQQSEIPPRVWSLLDDPLDTESMAAVREFMAGQTTFLVLSGGVGCGKTVAACAALDKAGGRFIKAPGVTRARFSDEAWVSLLHESVVVVDDLGTESLDEKGWAAGAFAEFFDHRYDWQAKTILTTNLDADSFKRRYCEADGGRFLSRLREAGSFISVAQGSLRAVNQGRAS